MRVDLCVSVCVCVCVCARARALAQKFSKLNTGVQSLSKSDVLANYISRV